MIDILDKFSPHLKTVLTRALTFVVENENEMITPLHLLWAISTEADSQGSKLLEKCGIKPAAIENVVNPRPTPHHLDHVPGTTPLLSEQSKKAIEKAILTANLHEHKLIGTEHLLFGILTVKMPEVTALLEREGVKSELLETEITQLFRAHAQVPAVTEQKPVEKMEQCAKCGHVHAPVSEEDEQSALEFFSVELTHADRVKKTESLVGRDEEVTRLARILTRKTKNNPLLLGDPGVGKTAIVEGLAKKIAEGKAPEGLQGAKIYMLDMASLVAGTMYRGDFEARLADVIDDLKETKDAILFIDEIHMLVGAGAGSGAMDAANIMKPALARGEIRVIGATTREEFKKHFEEDGALSRRFAPITVREPNAAETLKILLGIAPSYEKHHSVRFHKDVFQTVVDISSRYFPHKAFPDKAIDLLDEVGSALRGKKEHIDAQAVRTVAASITGVPLERLTEGEDVKLKSLDTRLQTRVVGQDKAVSAVADAVRRAKLGFSKPERPLASFLFVGPSGVGKTELAKAIATEVFEDEKALIRLDMSEYADSFTASKLIGSPPGFVGYRETARLTDAVKARPYSVVLFDEMEKAHRDIHHLILQILDEGVISDAAGVPINFRNAIIVMTSNAGRDRFTRGSVGFTSKEPIAPDARGILEDHFSAEFLNRIDKVCLFSPLSTNHYEQIVRRELSLLANRLKTRGISLKTDASALKLLVKSVNAKLGARDVRRVISEVIEKPLSEKVLNGLGKKAKNYRVKASKGGLTIQS